MEMSALILAFSKSFLLALAGVLPILNPPATAPVFVNLPRDLDPAPRRAPATRTLRNLVALPGSALEKALLVIVALLYTLLSALAALALGLKMPNLTWTNETTPIKQSGCVMLSLFANWFYALALGGLYFLCGNALSAAVYLAIFAVVTAAGSALLLRWVKKQGARIFAAL